MRKINQLMDLTGRVALVSGGGGNIGLAAAETLAELGATIILLDIDAETTQINIEKVENEYDVKVKFLPVDLHIEEKIQSIPQLVVEQYGRLDILINSAAVVGTTQMPGWVTPFVKQESTPWREALEINLTAVFLLTQACTSLLSESGHGTVINIGSIYGLVGPDLRLYEGTNLGNPAAYAASKGGLLQLTRWLSTVLAPDVRVNSISPGGVWRNQAVEFRERYETRTPLKRMAVEEDIKGAIGYLSSDMSSYVTGHDLVVDGGWTAW